MESIYVGAIDYGDLIISLEVPSLFWFVFVFVFVVFVFVFRSIFNLTTKLEEECDDGEEEEVETKRSEISSKSG